MAKLKKPRHGASKAAIPSAAPLPRSRRKGAGYVLKRILFSIVFTALLLLGMELILRAVGFSYQPRQKVLWTPVMGEFLGTYEVYVNYRLAPPGYIWVAEPNTVLTDPYGFRKPEIPFKKPDGKKRVAFLGGSTTMASHHPYPERTIGLINDAIGTNEYEMLNVAASSYTTHQSLKALERWVFPRDVDTVVVYHGWNDMDVQGDGYRDDEKDILTEVGVSTASPFMQGLMRTRIAQLLGRIMDAADTSWPRSRVGLARYRENLRAMARLCAERGVKMVLVIRPQSQARPFVFKMDERKRDVYAREFGATGTDEEIYDVVHGAVTGIQWEVARAFSNVVVVADASTYLNEVQAAEKAGAFGDRVETFRLDTCHLFNFGNQRLAEFMAPILAPEYAERIEGFVNSADYSEQMARAFREEEDPFEAVYFANQALARDPARAERLMPLIEEQEGDFEFEQLFREGRWGGGSTRPFDERMWRLKRCLELRPSDLGVAVQIFRTCIYSDRAGEAAAAMAGFKPGNERDRLEWLSMTFESHARAQRWQQAYPVAMEILRIQPNNPAARAFVEAVRRGA